jgi:hypothetical protein
MNLLSQDQEAYDKKLLESRKERAEKDQKRARMFDLAATIYTAADSATKERKLKQETKKTAEKYGLEEIEEPELNKKGRPKLFGKETYYTTTDNYGNVVKLKGSQVRAIDSSLMIHSDKTFSDVLYDQYGQVKTPFQTDEYRGATKDQKNIIDQTREGMLKPTETEERLQSAGFDQELLDEIFGEEKGDLIAGSKGAKTWDWLKGISQNFKSGSSLETSDNEDFSNFLQRLKGDK